MTARRMRSKLELGSEDMEKLLQLSVSRTEPYDQVTRAKILLAYHAGESKSAIARRIGVSRPTVHLSYFPHQSAEMRDDLLRGIKFARQEDRILISERHPQGVQNESNARNPVPSGRALFTYCLCVCQENWRSRRS